MDAYDDDEALAQYVVRNFPQLMSPMERRVYYLAIKREKAAVSESAAGRLPRWLAAETADVVEASEAGLFTVKQRIAKRILADGANGGLKINRCPKCSRIVRTSLAQQCLWCGHDWHSRP